MIARPRGRGPSEASADPTRHFHTSHREYRVEIVTFLLGFSYLRGTKCTGGLSLHTNTWSLHSAIECVQKNSRGRAVDTCDPSSSDLTPSAAPPVAEEATHERNAATDADDSIDGPNVGLSRGGQHERTQPRAAGGGWRWKWARRHRHEPGLERLRIRSFGRSSKRHEGAHLQSTERPAGATLEPTALVPRGQGGELRHYQASTLHRRHVPAPRSLAAQRAVPPVLDRVVRPSRDELRDLRPAAA